MIYPERMERVVIAAPTSHLKKTIELLYKHKVLHIIEHRKEAIDIGSPLPGSSQLADLLVRVRSMIHALSIQRETAERVQLNGDLSARVLAVHEEVTVLTTQLRHLEEQLAAHAAERNAYAQLEWLHVNPTILHDSKLLTYFFGTVKKTEGLAQRLNTITAQHYYEHQPNGLGVFILVDTARADETKKLLEEYGFIAADHNRIVKLNKPLVQEISALEEAMRITKKEVATTQKQLAELGKQYAPFLVSAEQILAVEAKKAQVPLRFGVTKNSFIANGWVPKANYEPLKKDLEAALKQEVHIEHLHTHEEAPIKLDNSFVVSPFESLLRLYTLPKYHEIDPSTLLFLSFPLFFGFMLGDIGYGLTLLVLFMGLRALSKSAEVRAMASVLIMSSVASVIFGIVFGEFFGAEHIGHIELHPLIHRTHDMTTLLGVAVAVGVVHITLAYIVGFINEIHHHGGWKAFCAKISWIILLAGVGLLAAGYLFHMPLVLAGYLTIALSIVLIYIGEGVKGLVELPGIFSNIMSYARLMAIGVASAALAIVVNELAGGLFASHSIAGIIGGILILILGHAINIALGIIGPFLHSLRLHYVEFFSKFYEGGGKPYKPFGVDEQ